MDNPPNPSTSNTEKAPLEVSVTQEVLQTTSSLCAGAHPQILLQTARLELIPPTGVGLLMMARAIFDSGSQRTYISSQLRDRLKLPTASTERIQIKTFGSADGCDKLCDIVHLKIRVNDGETLEIAALVVPLVCSPLMSQPIDIASECYEHLTGLELADSGDSHDMLEVDVLIGSDWYWSFVTGRVIKGTSEPTAIHTKVGWILSGPVGDQVVVNLTLTSTHALRVDTFMAEPSLDDQLKKFWELESLGIPKDESSVYERFLQQISFDGRRYEVSLPWKEYHPPLPDHYELCRKRLEGLLKRLKQSPQLFAEYDKILCD